MSRSHATVPMPTADPSTMGKDELVREIEQTREELVQTVDAIVERVDPGQVAQRTAEQVRRTTSRTATDLRGRAEEALATARELTDRDPALTRVVAATVVGAAVVLVVNELRPARSGRR